MITVIVDCLPYTPENFPTDIMLTMNKYVNVFFLTWFFVLFQKFTVPYVCTVKIFRKKYEMHQLLLLCRAGLQHRRGPLYRPALLHRRVVMVVQRNLILGIETSCDDTGAALIDLQGLKTPQL